MNKKEFLYMALVGCIFGVALYFVVESSNKADYDSETFHTAIQSGEDAVGKTVEFEVRSVEENLMMGQVLSSKNGLSFTNGKRNQVEEGETITVEIEDYGNVFGQWIVVFTEVVQ